MRKLVDSHSHVNLLEYTDNFYEYFNDMEILEIFEYDSKIDLNLINKFKEHGAFVAAGLHPLSAKYELEQEIIDFFDRNIHNLHGIGETGIDLYKSNNYEEQKHLLKIHIKYAKQFNKPIIIHCRGEVDIDEILNELDKTCFVFHCFTYDEIIAQKVINANGYVSFSGIITFKNSETIRKAAAIVPMHRILCETDTPFLAPNPHRGQKNQPKYVRYVYEECARIKNVDMPKFEKQIHINFHNFLKCIT